jgi:hypothetical protein
MYQQHSLDKLLLRRTRHLFSFAHLFKPLFKQPEPLVRIELTTSSLPRKCSTTELQRLVEYQ